MKKLLLKFAKERVKEEEKKRMEALIEREKWNKIFQL